MGLTRRRKEFLAEVVRQHSDSGTSVHHHEVASTLGVSDATSYAMLRALEDAGYLERQYAPTGRKGRAPVVYCPTQRAADLFSAQAHTFRPVDEAQWKTSLDAIVATIEALRTSDPGPTVASLASFIGQANSRLEICAGILALFSVQLRSLGPAQAASVRSLCEAVPAGTPRLDAFITCLWGTTISGMGAGLTPQTGQMVARFIQTAGQLNKVDVERLLALLDPLLFAHR